MKSFLLPAVWMLTALLSVCPARAQKAPAERVSLFALQKGGADSLIFTFPRETPASADMNDGVFTVVFDSAADPDALKLGQVLTAFPEPLRDASLSQTDGKLTLTYALPDGYDASRTVSGRRVTVSLFKKDNVPDVEKTSAAGPSVRKTPEKKDPLPPPPAAVPSVSVPVPPAAVVKRKDAPAPAVSADTQDLSAPAATESLPSAPSFPTLGGGDHDSVFYAASLSFPWRLPTPAAAFRRGGYVWIVFNGKGDFNFDMEREIYKNVIYEIVRIPHSQATIFRLVTAPGYNPSMRREGLLWIVDLMYSPVHPKKDIPLLLQRKTPFGPRISIPLKEKTEVLSMVDPEIGDLFYIIPVFAAGEGLSHRRDFVDASFLPSAQGLVATPNVEDLDVVTFSSGIEIRGGDKGLRFSSGDLPQNRDLLGDPMSQTLEIGLWGAASDGRGYYNTLSAKQDAVFSAPKGDKNMARLELARFYLANGMYPETLSVLRTVAADDPLFAALRPVVVLRGAANFMMKRYEEAAADFRDPAAGNSEYVRFWRAAARSAAGQRSEANLTDFRETMGVLRSYPQMIRARLALTALPPIIDAGDDYTAQNLLETAANSQNTNSVATALDYYYALWLEMGGNYGMALNEMRKVADGTDLYFRAMGGLEKIRLAKRNKSLTPEDQLRELELLSYAWRGDGFEQKLMWMLVAAYQDQKDYENVLRTLRDMQVRFSKRPESAKIPGMMRDLIEKIYLKENILKDSPIKAIALYDEFHDYLPTGEKGTQIARQLADELVAMDLLDRAAALLESKLKDPVSQTERGLLTTRLALVRVLNREPQAAMDTLDASDDLPFSPAVSTQRRFIRAKALADLKRISEAADLLEEDSSEESRQLLAEIFWQAQEWGKAADVMKTLIKRPDPKSVLSDGEAQLILNWAAALRLAGRPKVVIRLRENFLPYMKKTSLAEAFDFITKTTQTGVMDYRQVEQEVESAKSFTSFAKKYTSILKEKGLSQTVQ